ncbi:MAG: PAS domain S-box protein [Acidobacteriota bacterium]
MPLMIRFLGRDGRVELVNRTWERTLGWSLEEAQHRNLDLLHEFYPDSLERQRALDFIAAAMGDWADFRIRMRDGRVIDATFANIRLSNRVHGNMRGCGVFVAKYESGFESGNHDRDGCCWRSAVKVVEHCSWCRASDRSA